MRGNEGPGHAAVGNVDWPWFEDEQTLNPSASSGSTARRATTSAARVSPGDRVRT